MSSRTSSRPRHPTVRPIRPAQAAVEPAREEETPPDAVRAITLGLLLVLPFWAAVALTVLLG